MCDVPFSSPDIPTPFFNKFGIVLWGQLRLVGEKEGKELHASYLELLLEFGESSAQDENFVRGVVIFL
jgi:hypothetical protein